VITGVWSVQVSECQAFIVRETTVAFLGVHDHADPLRPQRRCGGASSRESSSSSVEEYGRMFGIVASQVIEQLRLSPRILESMLRHGSHHLGASLAKGRLAATAAHVHSQVRTQSRSASRG